MNGTTHRTRSFWIALFSARASRARCIGVFFIATLLVQAAVVRGQTDDTNAYVLRAYEVPQLRTWVDRYAAVGDTIAVDVRNFDKWLGAVSTNSLPRGYSNVSLFINGRRLISTPRRPPEVVRETTTFEYNLTRNSTNDQVWADLLKLSFIYRKVEMSVGIGDQMIMPTRVTARAPKEEAFYLLIAPSGPLILGGLIIIISLYAFFLLARDTDLIRDTTAPLRPDGRAPLSLARAQMAFWFFLVIGSFFIIWAITGRMETLTTSVLALIGISASTAISAAVIDSSKVKEEDRLKNVPVIPLKGPVERIVKQLQEERETVEAQLSRLRSQYATVPLDALVQHVPYMSARASLYKHLELIRSQIDFFKRPRVRRVLLDLLGEDQVITFHRFQIFVWTLVLGVVFVSKVFMELTMPEFPGALLGLMGISAGTYVGFKIPDQRRPL